MLRLIVTVFDPVRILLPGVSENYTQRMKLTDYFDPVRMPLSGTRKERSLHDTQLTDAQSTAGQGPHVKSRLRLVVMIDGTQ
jgi:hypothetical protein